MSLSKTTLDHETLQAIDVLIRAVEQARVPGVLEFRLLGNALRRALESRSDRELDEAARIFQTLDSEFRARIVAQAQETAQAQAATGQAAGPMTGGPAAQQRDKPGLSAAGLVRSATGFLAAINGRRGPGNSANTNANTHANTSADDSRNTAKARLMQAVEERRERDLAASSLLPGARLPRSGWSS